MRIINTSAENHYTFWIDGHTFTVVATDFVPIEPYPSHVLNVAIGEF
jgi:FtsP/CotA-like multicopper oxidase with cupredoxin domain